MRSISVIIPNFNGRELLEANLPSVVRALAPYPGYEIIVCDDASQDDSLLWLKTSHPDVHVIVQPRQSGFGTNANSGIRAAKGDITCVLNSDLRLAPDYFEHLLPYFELGDTFGVMGAIYDREDGRLTDSAKFPELSLTGLRSTINYVIAGGPIPRRLPTLFLSGANLVVDTQKLKTLGGFDEIFSPFYSEDVDLSLRAWRMGWHCWYEPKARSFHECSQTVGKVNRDWVKVIANRNRLTLHAIHMDGIYRVGWFLSLAVKLATSWIFFRWKYYRGFMGFAKIRALVCKSRSSVKRLGPGRNVVAVRRFILQTIQASTIKKF